jgi:hypothetical protein
MSTPTTKQITADLKSRGLDWSTEYTGPIIEVCIWAWPNVIARYRPHTTEPLAKMLAAAAFEVDWTKYPVLK